MNVIPQIDADFETYPELRRVYDVTVGAIASMMQVHNIGELRRIRKSGVFDRQYFKDVVADLGVEGTPATVDAVKKAVGKALLDYMDTIGLRGVRISASDDDMVALKGVWGLPASKEAVDDDEAPVETEAQDTPDAPETVVEGEL